MIHFDTRLAIETQSAAASLVCTRWNDALQLGQLSGVCTRKVFAQERMPCLLMHAPADVMDNIPAKSEANLAIMQMVEPALVRLSSESWSDPRGRSGELFVFLFANAKNAQQVFIELVRSEWLRGCTIGKGMAQIIAVSYEDNSVA